MTDNYVHRTYLIRLKRRNFWGRLLYMPKIVKTIYVIHRRDKSILRSLYRGVEWWWRTF